MLTLTLLAITQAVAGVHPCTPHATRTILTELHASCYSISVPAPYEGYSDSASDPFVTEANMCGVAGSSSSGGRSARSTSPPVNVDQILESRCQAADYAGKAKALAEQPEMDIATSCAQVGGEIVQGTYTGAHTAGGGTYNQSQFMKQCVSGRALRGGRGEWEEGNDTAVGPVEVGGSAQDPRPYERYFVVRGLTQGRSLKWSGTRILISETHWVDGRKDGEEYQYDESGNPLRLVVYAKGAPTGCAGACSTLPGTPILSSSSFGQFRNSTFMASMGSAGQADQQHVASDAAARAQRDAEAATALAAQIARSRKAGPEAAVAQGFGAVSSECSNVQLYSNGLSANGSFDVRGEGDCVEYSQALRKNLVVRKKIQMQIFPKADGQWYLYGSVSYYD